MSRKYVLGLDFGTESGRALLACVESGEEAASAVAPYPHGVIDAALPGTGETLPPDWALQHPGDYLEVMRKTVPEALAKAGARPADVVGIGVDFTACTVLPIDREGAPLCLNSAWAAEKHAWCKLWKHHGAAAQAARMTGLALAMCPDLAARYGGAISSEWLFPKILETLENAPAVYEAADQFIEAGDWIVLQLTGAVRRNACAAGYKALWDESGYPSPDLLKALDPRFENVVQEKLRGDVYPMGAKAGELTPKMAETLGLAPGTAVAVAAIDAHMGVPGAGVSAPGQMVLIMGTSLCHMVCGTEKHLVRGVAGVVKDGILPGYHGYEAGQAAVGDIFAWYVKQIAPGGGTPDALHAALGEEAARLAPGASGLVCLDWWNGNRSVLANPNLSGVIAGLNLATTPAEIYRALLESTAFGTNKIIREMEAGGVPIDALFACGGLPNKNPLLMQIFADVTGREIHVAASEQTVALGAAMWGAVAAGKARGGHDSIQDAVAAMGRLREEPYRPGPACQEAYAALYALYERLHDQFGLDDDTMKSLKEIRRRARAQSA